MLENDFKDQMRLYPGPRATPTTPLAYSDLQAMAPFPQSAAATASGPYTHSHWSKV
ncbi:hypothetical protein H0H92_011745, partial [Tricholoma furcatifolium]